MEGMLWENFRSSRREAYKGTPSLENGNRKWFLIEWEKNGVFQPQYLFIYALGSMEILFIIN